MTNNFFKIFQFTVFFLVFSTAMAQNPTPAAIQTKPIVLKGGTIHTATGEVIQNGSIIFEKGIITAIGINLTFPADAEVIDITTQHVYPGLILPSTSLGLSEVDAVRPTLDYQETGEFNPNAKAIVAYNTDSELIPTIRANGILLAQIRPSGGIISGSSSIVALDGWNWEDAVFSMDEGIHLNWPAAYVNSGWWAEPESFIKNEKKDETVEKLKKFFENAWSYAKNPTPSTINLKFEATKGLFDGSKTLYVHANQAKEIIESVQFAKSYQVKKITIIGGEDAYLIIDFIKEHNLPILLSRLTRLPNYNEEDVDMPYKLPATLQKAGILVGLNYAGGMEVMGSRNLPFLAGIAARYGLNKEEALQLVTFNTAKILGIDKKVGSLEKNKQATLIVSKGDLLDMRTNQVTYAFIEGKKVDLDTKHQRLYKKFKGKYAR